MPSECHAVYVYLVLCNSSSRFPFKALTHRQIHALSHRRQPPYTQGLATSGRPAGVGNKANLEYKISYLWLTVFRTCRAACRVACNRCAVDFIHLPASLSLMLQLHSTTCQSIDLMRRCASPQAPVRAVHFSMSHAQLSSTQKQ